MKLMCALVPAVALSSSSSSVLASSSECDFGPTHHSHLVLPLAANAEECKLANASFLLSHGATFFCPHTFDVKLLGHLAEEEARNTLCDTHFDSVERGLSSKMVLRPTLPAGGLPALARGELSSWESPVMYHVHSFGKDNSAGPDAGWNVTTVRNATTRVDVERVLYGRRLDIQPKPASLTYLAHSGGSTGKAVLSHYISTSGSSGFDHILKVDISYAAGHHPVSLRQTWPTYLTIPDREDALDARLKANDTAISGLLHVYDADGLPTVAPVEVSVSLDYYVGTSDGFAGYGTMCPGDQQPPSPTTCVGSH